MARRKKEESLPDGYFFRQRDLKPYKARLSPRDRADLNITIQLAKFQNDWDLIGPDGEIVVRVSGSERQRAIDFLKLQNK